MSARQGALVRTFDRSGKSPHILSAPNVIGNRHIVLPQVRGIQIVDQRSLVDHLSSSAQYFRPFTCSYHDSESVTGTLFSWNSLRLARGGQSSDTAVVSLPSDFREKPS